jgi:sigma-B regulation protein RsbU (phosphoserine phosphatase)
MIPPAECAGLDGLRELDPRRLAGVLKHCRIATFATGELILQRGAVNEHLYFVISGLVHVYFESDCRSQAIEIGTGQMFGEISVLDQLPVTAFVAAAEPCRILLLPAEVFWTDVVTVPGVARTVMRGLSNRLRDDAVVLSAAMRDRIRHAALERELGIARDIQMGMLRRADPWFPDRRDVDVVALTQPAKQVGGDFYDAFFLNADHLVLVIGDVAGNGISAAMFMVRALTLIRSAAAHWRSLPSTTQYVNRALAADNDASMFLTLFMGVLNTRTGMLEYVNYGHLPPLILGPDGLCASRVIPCGTMLGIIEHAEPGAGHIRLEPGSTIVLYTDGITEAADAQGALFGTAAFVAVVAAARAEAPGAIVSRVRAAIADYAGDAEQADDITLLCTRYNGPCSVA